MIKIFIDTNIYLNFYNNSSIHYQKLLHPLIEIKDSIFITEQIVNEVNRNKLEVACKCFEDFYKMLGIKKVNLPNHFDDKKKSVTSELNEEKESIIEMEEQYKKKFNDYVHSILSKIMRSEDKVSKTLNDIFKRASKPTNEQIEKAKVRKCKGNPPGKIKDPIGDELSWIQLLDEFDSETELWIVTTDTDFYSKYGNKLLLNSFLYNELRIKINNHEPKVIVFDNLTTSLEKYKIKQPQKVSLPDKEELDKIRSEESSSNTYIAALKIQQNINDIFNSPTMIELQRQQIELNDSMRKLEFAMAPTIQEIMRLSRFYSFPQVYPPNAFKDGKDKNNNAKDSKKNDNTDKHS